MWSVFWKTGLYPVFYLPNIVLSISSKSFIIEVTQGIDLYNCAGSSEHIAIIFPIPAALADSIPDIASSINKKAMDKNKLSNTNYPNLEKFLSEPSWKSILINKEIIDLYKSKKNISLIVTNLSN